MGTVFRRQGIVYMVHTRGEHGAKHVTVYKPRRHNFEAKARIDLEAMVVMDSMGFSQRALKRIMEDVKERRQDLLEEWNEKTEKVIKR